ncbi:FAD binding domain-containing protein [Phlyctema vagabunda]|uniref:FAD binding domain-containing protein n=1 Tax=Phlyctema vagabunda TaxID=108571 RepID=A0ABR4PEE6_9HELO
MISYPIPPHPHAITLTTTYPTNSLQFLKQVAKQGEDENKLNQLPPQTKLQLRIAIVGAGLGGLATAIALARHGHSVTVLEQAQKLGEVGAGIQIPPNSGLLLERWGVNPFLEGKISEPEGMTFRRWQDGSPIAYTKLLPEFRDNFKSSYKVVHRADYHNALYQRALQLGVDIKVNCRVVAYDSEIPAVDIADGSRISSDLVIGADDPASWKSESAIKDMRNEFTGWDSSLTKVINMIDKTLKWPLVSGSRLPTWTASSSKVIIIGDAAHAMVPYMSQGAAMAIEDGGALAVVLSLIEDRSEIPFALRVFEKERIKRTSQMQDASLVNGLLWHFRDGPEQRARDAAMAAEIQGRPFLSSANQWSDPVTQWWAYGYDAETEIERAWNLAVEGDTN